MSRNELKSYLKGLSKKQLEEQIIDLYGRFKPVKVYYDFVFNPKEDKLAEEAKIKIGKEYFPQSRRRPKMRRSVAQKLIKHFISIEMDPTVVADIMLFNIETALAYTSEKRINSEAFYKSMVVSYSSALDYIQIKGMAKIFADRCEAIARRTEDQGWDNYEAFVRAFEIYSVQLS